MQQAVVNKNHFLVCTIVVLDGNTGGHKQTHWNHGY
jgi:hypothetical protein